MGKEQQPEILLTVSLPLPPRGSAYIWGSQEIQATVSSLFTLAPSISHPCLFSWDPHFCLPFSCPYEFVTPMST